MTNAKALSIALAVVACVACVAIWRQSTGAGEPLVMGGLASEPVKQALHEQRVLVRHEDTHCKFHEYKSSPPGRFAAAVRLVMEAARGKSYEQFFCPKGQMLGYRPGEHAPALVGTTCEPWINRHTAMLLSHILHDNTMVGLEWSSGSSTMWLLRRLGVLHSVEHCESWLADIRKAVEAEMPWRSGSWKSHHVPCVDDTPGACKGPCGQAEVPGANYSAYAAFPAKHLLGEAPGGFDFVSVDGRWREECMAEVARSQILKRKYGLLLLDNAERKVYLTGVDKLPRHWVCVSFASTVDETALWLSCEENDPFCDMAQKDINNLMESLPAMQGSVWKHYASKKSV